MQQGRRRADLIDYPPLAYSGAVELVETQAFTKQIDNNDASNLTPTQVSQLARAVKEEFGE